MEAYGQRNVVALLEKQNLLPIVTAIMSFCCCPVLDFYANLTTAVGQPSSVKYGRVFVRNRIYNFTPSLINAFSNIADAEDGEINIDEATSTVKGGLIIHFPSLPQRPATESLTSLYSVLHETATRNWTPSSNSTIVTLSQVLVLYAIGTRNQFNFGKHVFETILAFADGGLRSTRLLFLFLIYGMLMSQGFISYIDEVLIGEVDKLKIAPTLLKGNMKIDLPWIATNVVTGVGNTATTSTNVQATPLPAGQSTTYVTLSTSFLQSQIDFGHQQIQQANDLISHYENQVTEFLLLLDVTTHSGQQGGEVENEDE